MKFQWTLVVGLLFAIIIAVFAVVNVDSVPVNYVFGEAEWPLVLVILCAALLGAVVSGLVAMFRAIQLNRRIKALEKEITIKESTIATQQNEIAELQKVVFPVEEQEAIDSEQTLKGKKH
ncbi:LapA family protein [Filibacter tadaridae]|uniref:LapA family protein n=1 Tax=Filibacter tadaridae TaxID=2483811 RepID=UPI000F52513E|nr:lipopolysaccharide assembly protein LapA domain-containing protein [Filibacter tadaridae]